MKKAIIILILLILVCFGIYKHIRNQKLKAEQKLVRAEKQLKNIDFHNYPVKDDVQQIPKNISFKTAGPETKHSSTSQRNIIGDKIPNWVYENTSSNDRYYSLIHSQTNFIFTSYADCPIGQGRRKAVSNAIARAGVSGQFLNRVELMPQGTQMQGTCSKTYKGNYCYAKQSEMKEGTCKCAIHYMLDGCMDKFCIVNPKQKRIVFVEPDENMLTTKLNELKNNW